MRRASIRKSTRRLYAVLVFALAAGTMAMLMVCAAVTLKATRDPQGAAVLALAAMWIPQQLITTGYDRRP